jgi:hypothetical protein
MFSNQQLLTTFLVQPAIAALSDADATAAANVPLLTPKATTVTATTVASVLGFSTAVQINSALNAAVVAGQASGATAAQQQFAAAANYALTVLGGAGLTPSDPQSQAAAAQFVSAGILTQAQLNLLFFNSTLPCGGTVATTDVATARALMMSRTLRQKVGRAAAAAFTLLASYETAINAGTTPAPTPPTTAALTAAITTAMGS